MGVDKQPRLSNSGYLLMVKQTYPLQCSCLENPRDGGASWAAAYGIEQSWTQLKRLSSSSSSRTLLGVLGHLSKSNGMSLKEE